MNTGLLLLFLFYFKEHTKYHFVIGHKPPPSRFPPIISRINNNKNYNYLMHNIYQAYANYFTYVISLNSFHDNCAYYKHYLPYFANEETDSEGLSIHPVCTGRKCQSQNLNIC